MRDPERIDRILNMLKAYWKTYPDTRLSQIVVNAANPSEPCPQVFHMEDDKLEDYLKEQLSSSWPEPDTNDGEEYARSLKGR